VTSEVAKLVAGLMRRGIKFSVVDGAVHMLGKVALEDLVTLSAHREEVKALVEQRAQKRRTRAEKRSRKEQQAAAEPPRARRVVGHQVVAGYPQLSRLLYEDEVREITPTRRARGLPSYGWRLFI
jgi:hypothetical protein